MAAEAMAAVGLGQGGSSANVAKIAIEQRKKKTDVVEPEVISEELLIKGVQEPERQDGEMWDPIDFPQVTMLSLNFQNIIEISNLNNFDSLTTLRLDNNIIDKIINLNHLTQLTWLDLSFNNIREIEGLNKLYKLLDLSLYHNQISEIKGLDDCPQLNILSLGHNNISELKQIDYLRKFHNLRCVCLDGNKVCQHDSYQQHVLAYLKDLKYLDYMLIDRKAISNAQDSYQLDELTEVKEREQAELVRVRQEEEKKKTLERLKESFLDWSEDFFEELFSKEVEPEHVTVLACYAALKEEYKDKLSEDIRALRGIMEEKNSERVKKVTSFEKAIRQAEQESEGDVFQLVKDFRSHQKKVLAQFDKDEFKADAKNLENLQNDLGRLENLLMANEIQLQESIEEAISEFETGMQHLTKAMQEKGSDFFRKLDDHEKSFNLSVTEGVTSEIDAFTQAQDSSHNDYDSLKARYLGNRDEFNSVVANFHDNHLTQLVGKEDYFNNQVASWRDNFFARHRELQYYRNRQRIMDTKKVIDDSREEIKAAEVGDEEYDHEQDQPRYG